MAVGGLLRSTADVLRSKCSDIHRVGCLGTVTGTGAVERRELAVLSAIEPGRSLVTLLAEQVMSFRSWTSRATTSTWRLTWRCTGMPCDNWRTSRTTRLWSPAVGIRQLPWSFVTWPQEGHLTSSNSPEWVTGSGCSGFRSWPRMAIFNWLSLDFLTFF